MLEGSINMLVDISQSSSSSFGFSGQSGHEAALPLPVKSANESMGLTYCNSIENPDSHLCPTWSECFYSMAYDDRCSSISIQIGRG